MKFSPLRGALMSASMLAAAAMLSPIETKAADLGGGCCADLEERVAELEATTARKGNRKVSLTVSGHVSQSVLFWDTSETFLNDALGDSPSIGTDEESVSRFRFKGEAKLGSGRSAGFLMEIGVPNSGDLSVRHAALWLKSETMGTIWLGRTSQASDRAMELSIANANDGITLGRLGNFGAALAGANFAPSPFNLNIDVRPLLAFDGGRTDLIKYISPSVAGFSLSASWSGDGSETWDVALRYAGEFGAVRVAAAAFHRDEQNAGRKVTGGSASIMHVTSGIFLDGSVGRSTGNQSIDIALGLGGVNLSFSPTICNCDVDMWNIRPGIKTKLNSLGATTFYGHYGEAKIDTFNVDAERYGGGIIQYIDAAAMFVSLDYSHYDLSIQGVGSGSADVVQLRTKLRF